MPNTPKIVDVTWVDSISQSGWQNPERKSEPLEPCITRTVGFLVHDEPDYITVSSHWNNLGHYADPMSIPRGAITTLKIVKVR